MRTQVPGNRHLFLAGTGQLRTYGQIHAMFGSTRRSAPEVGGYLVTLWPWVWLSSDISRFTGIAPSRHLEVDFGSPCDIHTSLSTQLEARELL